MNLGDENPLDPPHEYVPIAPPSYTVDTAPISPQTRSSSTGSPSNTIAFAAAKRLLIAYGPFIAQVIGIIIAIIMIISAVVYVIHMVTSSMFPTMDAKLYVYHTLPLVGMLPLFSPTAFKNNMFWPPSWFVRLSNWVYSDVKISLM
jgi:hypothetical protein